MGARMRHGCDRATISDCPVQVMELNVRMAQLFSFLGTLMAGLAPQAERMLVEVDFRLSEPRGTALRDSGRRHVR